MATYFIDSTNGSDSNNGLGPDASAVTNKPWKTVGKALGASGMASGDSVYLAPGVYREQVTASLTAPAVTTSIIGDPTNAQGFKTSGGVLVAAKEVRWTGFDVSDTATPTGGNPTLTLNGKPFLYFQYITFVGGKKANDGHIVDGTTAGSHDTTFLDCTFIQGAINSGFCCVFQTTLSATYNLTMKRCNFELHGGASLAIRIYLDQNNVADKDFNILLYNIRIQGGGFGIYHNASGSGTNKGGGVYIYNARMIGLNQNGVRAADANISTTVPIKVYNSILDGGTGVTLQANTTGQIVEDYNQLLGSTARTNVTAGTHSIANYSYANLIEVGQAEQQGRIIRPYGMPTADSPYLGFGGQGSGPTDDALARPRPAGGKSTTFAGGAYERHDTAIAGGSSNADAGSNCLQQTGPMDDDILIPVDAVATVITVRQKTASYVGTAYPQIVLIANAAIGVSTQTVADSSAHTSYTTLTLASFTPTAVGVVRLRLQNLTGDGAGIVYWDTMTRNGVTIDLFEHFLNGEIFQGGIDNIPVGASPLGSNVVRPAPVGAE